MKAMQKTQIPHMQPTNGFLLTAQLAFVTLALPHAPARAAEIIPQLL